MADFERLLQFWDFRYPYSPEVTCPRCGAHTADWRNDPAHPFHLTTANLGGLLVFRCKSCQSTVRQKHFRYATTWPWNARRTILTSFVGGVSRCPPSFLPGFARLFLCPPTRA